MANKMSRRKQAIIRRNIFLGVVSVILIAILTLIIVLAVNIAGALSSNEKEGKKEEITSSVSQETEKPKEPEMVVKGNYTLNADFSNLLLVNGENPLPEDYDYEGNLVTMDDKYRQPGYDLTQINADIYPYLQAMCEAAWEDDVPLKVCSPYRSYEIQQTLFNRQVQKQINNGYTGKEAEDRAATIVARPGTSEHHTGLAADFICSNDSFEGMPAFAWLSEHAAEYGFILRYPKDKQDRTGVIYESWHYRFVGIKEAQKIKASGLCLEEYLDKKQK